MKESKSDPPGGAPLTRLFADHPVRDGEVSFDFAGFSRTLAELALNPDNPTPFTIVVKGEWGRGKTTLLEQTRRILDREGADEAARERGRRRVRTLWFNAWKYPQEDTVLAGLLGALLDRLREGGLRDQLKALIDAYKSALPAKGIPAAIAAVLRASAGWIHEDLGGGDLVPASRHAGVQEKRAFYDHFRRLFEEVSYVWFHGAAALRDNFGKSLGPASGEEAVAVFLDDLDRCKEDRVFEVLEAINLFLDLPGVCFYLGLDWQRLTRILEKRAPLDQEKFLEKIVQVAFDLPEIAEEGAEQYIASLVRATPLEAVLGGEVRAVAEVLKSRNPRHAKRFLNDLSIRLGVMRHTGHLGAEGADQVPEGAVVSWHLLAESVAAETWRGLTASRGNLLTFLRRYESVRDRKPDEVGVPREEEREAVQVFEKERLRPHVERLLALSPAQRDLLVHLGSPPRIEAKPSPKAAAKFDFDPDGPWWVPIEGGELRMGSEDGAADENPVHPVRVTPYKISRCPVTNAQYAAYVREAKAFPPSHWPEGRIPEGKENHPVVEVSWDEAAAFCAWLSNRIGRNVHLPSEAQWELAARGAEGREYPWGYEEPTPERANFGMSVGDTTPVDAYPAGATPQGVLDLAGNVWECCGDWFGPYAKHRATKVDPLGPSTGTERVVRGGSWGDDPRDLRSACRGRDEPSIRSSYIGFRCAQDQEPLTLDT